MIHIDIPGGETLELAHLVLDFNGTLALDGQLLPGVSQRLQTLAEHVSIHIVTADTFGNVARIFEDTPYRIVVLAPGAQDTAKQQVVRDLDPTICAAMGNGRNDVLMLAEASLGIGLIQQEGAFPGILTTADVVSTNILNALDLLINPLRLAATLRK